MGCLLSLARSSAASHGEAQSLMSMVAFFPGLRLPLQTTTLGGGPNGLSAPHIWDQLLACRDRLIALASVVDEELADILFPGHRSDHRKSASERRENGGSNIADLQQALEDYLLSLLSLAKEDAKFTLAAPLIWKNQEDDQTGTSIPDWRYEVLSVLHAMAVLNLYQANLLLSTRDNQMMISERSKQAIDILLKVSAVLQCAVKYIIPEFSEESRLMLPNDLKEEVLHALSMQALGQCVELQLGLAIDNTKATLAVKRRLACEQVTYLQKAHEALQNVEVDGLWGGKHQLFLSWKLAEAMACAFYFHGLILDEGDEDVEHAQALLCLKSASGHYNDSQKLSESFCSTPPMTRTFPVCGTLKYLSSKIPKDFSSRSRKLQVATHVDKLGFEEPSLPDFPLSLHPEEFKLPEI